MHIQSFALLAACATGVSAAAVDVPASYMAGFMSPETSTSVGGNANCITGNVPVTASTTKNVKLNFAVPANQTVVTGTLIEFSRINSTLMKQVMGPTTTVSGTYNISATLCFPKGGLKGNTVQLLTHGVGFGKGYWNFAPNFSYVDVAAAAGYATLSYDRLGVGNSAKPDGIQVVQSPFEVEIAHQLATMLTSGKFASRVFKNVVGVGHSFGSIITEALTSQYPSLLSAAVLTGFSTNTKGQLTFLAGLDLTIAAQNSPAFKGLNNAYLVANNIIGNQFAFFSGPSSFPPANLVLAEATKQTVTFGELLTLASVIAPATQFTGPIDVVNGEFDLAFCDGNCRVPKNAAAAVKGALYPAASNGSQHYLSANAGHGLNTQYSAGAAFAQIQKFLKSNNL